MPYIAQEDREKYLPIISAVVDLIPQGDVAETGDAFTAFIRGIEWRYQQAWLAEKDYQPHGHNQTEIDLDRQAIEVARHLQGCSFEKSMGELNFVVSSVLWRIIGDDGKYALRSYLKGCLIRQIRRIAKWEDHKSIALGGVLGDVVDECYRRCTAPYEDSKIAQHGDIV